ncbi:MAG: YerC/YecD family TrpR-related protein [Oscillospiraceae bacterium]|nr:YerC/YecD family TrpR-related protein [Oscillospiraceae bacterium]
MNKNIKKPRHMDVYEAIVTLETVEECIALFDDLLSVAELRAMEQRYQVAQMLDEGLVYSAILEKTGASSATISRVNRSLQSAGDGYRTAFARVKEQAGNKE